MAEVNAMLDLAGDDRSESSNFSQACAYFFGVGLKLDLAGNDRHCAARYGHAAGAHYGLGLSERRLGQALRQRPRDEYVLSTKVGRLLEPNPPKNARLILGYSGWGPRQLEAELNASAWLIADVDRELIFNTPADRMWETAIRRLGADPATLQMSRGIH